MLPAAGDFGIAKQLLEAGAQAHTMVGTPYYMAPELLQVGLLLQTDVATLRGPPECCVSMTGSQCLQLSSVLGALAAHTGDCLRAACL